LVVTNVLPSFGQRLVEPAALRVGVAPIWIKDGVKFDWEIVLALQTASDRQFYTRVLLAKLGELAVGELPLVDEIAKRSFGEPDPVRTAGKARRAGR
jgi:hypothetical protein